MVSDLWAGSSGRCFWDDGFDEYLALDPKLTGRSCQLDTKSDEERLKEVYWTYVSDKFSTIFFCLSLCLGSGEERLKEVYSAYTIENSQTYIVCLSLCLGYDEERSNEAYSLYVSENSQSQTPNTKTKGEVRYKDGRYSNTP